MPGTVSGGPDWGGELFILFITASYLAVILALTARCARVAPPPAAGRSQLTDVNAGDLTTAAAA